MYCNPKIGDRVRIAYRPKLRALFYLHGETGTIVIVSNGKLRNHAVRIDATGDTVVIPSGHLNRL